MARRHGGTAASPSVVIAVGLDAAGPDSDDGFPGTVWVKRRGSGTAAGLALPEP